MIERFANLAHFSHRYLLLQGSGTVIFAIVKVCDNVVTSGISKRLHLVSGLGECEG